MFLSEKLWEIIYKNYYKKLNKTIEKHNKNINNM